MDVFGTDSRLGGVFKGTLFKLSLGGAGGLNLQGALVQNINISYQRQLSRIWELGSTDQYYIEGRAEGQGGLQQIIGPKGLVQTLLTQLGNSCGASTRALTLTAGTNDASCGVNGQTQMVLGSPSAVGFSLGADAQQFVINTGLTMIFTSLSL